MALGGLFIGCERLDRMIALAACSGGARGRYLCIERHESNPMPRSRGAFVGVSALVLLSLVLGATTRAVPMSLSRSDGPRDSATVRELPGQFVKAVRKIVGESGHQPALASCEQVARRCKSGVIEASTAPLASRPVALRCEMLDLPPPARRA